MTDNHSEVSEQHSRERRRRERRVRERRVLTGRSGLFDAHGEEIERRVGERRGSGWRAGERRNQQSRF